MLYKPPLRRTNSSEHGGDGMDVARGSADQFEVYQQSGVWGVNIKPSQRAAGLQPAILNP